MKHRFPLPRGPPAFGARRVSFPIGVVLGNGDPLPVLVQVEVGGQMRGKVFRDPDGFCFTNRDSRTPVTFPYTPATVYVDVPAELAA